MAGEDTGDQIGEVSMEHTVSINGLYYHFLTITDPLNFKQTDTYSLNRWTFVQLLALCSFVPFYI